MLWKDSPADWQVCSKSERETKKQLRNRKQTQRTRADEAQSAQNYLLQKFIYLKLRIAASL